MKKVTSHKTLTNTPSALNRLGALWLVLANLSLATPLLLGNNSQPYLPIALPMEGCTFDSAMNSFMQPCGENAKFFKWTSVYLVGPNELAIGDYPTYTQDAFEPGEGDSYLCSSNLEGVIKESDCWESCSEQKGPYTCSGDTAYCSKRQCVDKFSSNCKCVTGVVIRKRYVALPKGDRVYYAKDKFALGYIKRRRLSNVRKLLSVDTPSKMECYLVENSVQVLLHEVAGEQRVILNKQDWSTMKPIVDRVFSVLVPETVLSVSGQISVKLYTGSESTGSCVVEVPGYSVCKLINCVFCRESFDNYQCLPASLKYLTFVLFLVSTYLMLFVFWNVAKVGFTLIRAANYLMSCCGCRRPFDYMIMRIKGVKKEVIKKETDFEIIEKEYAARLRKGTMDTVRSTTSTRPYSVPAGQRVKFGIRQAEVVTVLSLVALVKACDVGLFIPVSFNECVENSTSISCSMTYSLTVSMPFSESISCVTLGDITTGKLLGSFEISYDSLSVSALTTVDYYTSDYTPTQYSTHYCADESPCSSTGCGVQRDDDPGEIFSGNPDLNLPGTTTCHTGPGCSTNGCWSCGSTCTYTRWSLKPFGDVCSVGKVTQFKSTPSLSVDFVDPTGARTSVVKSRAFEDGAEVLTDEMRIKVIGRLASNTYQLQGSVVKCPHDIYYGSSSEVNNPAAGNVGDIQSSTPEGFAQQGKKSFIFATGLAQINQGKYDTVDFINPGFKLLTTKAFQRLPAWIAGLNWEPSEIGMSTLAVGSAPILLTLNSVRPVTYSSQKSIVCPVFTFLSGTGCYSCDQGTVLLVEVYSTCSEGVVGLTTNEEWVKLDTTRVSVSKKKDQKTISLHTNRQHNDFYIVVITGSESLSFRVTFDSFFINKVIERNTTTGNVIIGGGSSYSSNALSISSVLDSIKSFFTGGWQEIIFMIAVVIGGAGLYKFGSKLSSKSGLKVS